MHSARATRRNRLAHFLTVPDLILGSLRVLVSQVRFQNCKPLLSIVQGVMIYSLFGSAASLPQNEMRQLEESVGTGAGSSRHSGSLSRSWFISAGSLHSCGVSANGTGYCWGYNTYGQTNVPSGVVWAAISAGSSHSCGVSVSGTGYCWGRNSYGEINVPSGVV